MRDRIKTRQTRALNDWPWVRTCLVWKNCAKKMPTVSAGKWGPRASPAQRLAWGRGGAAEYSRRNGSRQKRLPFLSRTELAPTWCTKTGKIRTEVCRLELRESDGFRALLVVEHEFQVILIEIDRIDEGVDQAAAVLQLLYIQFPQAVEPEQHLILRQSGSCHLLPHDLDGQPALLLFQGFQTILGRGRQDSLLNGADQIVDCLLRIRVLLVKQRQHGVFRVEHIQGSFGNEFDQLVVKDDLPGQLDRQILDPLLADALFVTAAVVLDADAFIIPMRSVSAGSALTSHVAAAFAAELLCGQQILVLCLMLGRGFFVCRHSLLYPVEQILGNDCGDAVRLNDVPIPLRAAAL